MEGKVKNSIFVFSILFFLVTVCSCKKKYDYGNIITPDIMSENESLKKVNVPSLGDKVQLTADWELDENGIEKLKNRIEDFSDNFVELDMSECVVPEGKYGDEILPANLFQGMNNLGSVILPTRLLTLSEGFFRNCLNLQKVVLPARLISIEGHPFEGCASLKEIYTSGNPIYIFSYQGDGLVHPGLDSSFKGVKVYYEKNVVDYEDWYQYCWDYTKRLEPKKVSFTEIWASSFQDGYEPSHLADGNWGSWFEDDPGDGVGQEVVLYFTRMNPVSTITFRNGNGNTKNFWKTNRVKNLDVYFGNDPIPENITLRDTCESQTFRFLYGTRKIRQFEKIRFVIRSVYEGGDGKETAIAEISINDSEMRGYQEDSFTREMISAVPKIDEGESFFEYKIWRPRESYPVMLGYTKTKIDEDYYTKNLTCKVYDGEKWTSAQKKVWSKISSVVDSSAIADKRLEFSFEENESGVLFKIQLKRPVKKFSDADYGNPYLFDFDGIEFGVYKNPDFTMKKVSAGTDDFFSILENLNPKGIYRVDLKGELNQKFFDKMHDLLAADKKLAVNRNYILNMWDCSFAPEMQDTLVADSLSGYFIQLVLPEHTKRILKSSISVAADIITIPSGVEKIESGAFISSHGSEFDLYQNNVTFDGKKFAKGYSIQGRLLLESIPDSGGMKKLLLYCGNANELLGLDDSSQRKLVLPENVSEIAGYAFYGSDLESIVFPSTFEKAEDHCFDLTRLRGVDLSSVDVEKFSMETVKQFGLLLSSNPNLDLRGDFYCISASGKMSENLIKKIVEEMNVRRYKKVYLDLSGTSLIWNEKERKFENLPDMFLYNFQNLYWISLGRYNYLPQNTCRECHQLRYVQFTQEPEVIAEPSFKGCHATAQALVNGKSIPLWDYAQSLKIIGE